MTGAELCDKDIMYDLSLNSNRPVRVRRCSIDDSYPTISDAITDIFLSSEQTNRDTIRELKTEIEDENYFCSVGC